MARSTIAGRTRVWLRQRLDRSGSYPAIEASAVAGGLRDLLPITVSEHIGMVYRRVEVAAGEDVAEIASLRLAVLLHEESANRVPTLLETAGLSDFAPVVGVVIARFGCLWKIGAAHELADYVAAHRAYLAPLLLFELAHEGRATPEMERAAHLAGLALDFQRWTARLTTR